MPYGSTSITFIKNTCTHTVRLDMIAGFVLYYGQLRFFRHIRGQDRLEVDYYGRCSISGQWWQTTIRRQAADSSPRVFTREKIRSRSQDYLRSTGDPQNVVPKGSRRNKIADFQSSGARSARRENVGISSIFRVFAIPLQRD